MAIFGRIGNSKVVQSFHKLKGSTAPVKFHKIADESFPVDKVTNKLQIPTPDKMAASHAKHSSAELSELQTKYNSVLAKVKESHKAGAAKQALAEKSRDKIYKLRDELDKTDPSSKKYRKLDDERIRQTDKNSQLNNQIEVLLKAHRPLLREFKAAKTAYHQALESRSYDRIVGPRPEKHLVAVAPEPATFALVPVTAKPTARSPLANPLPDSAMMVDHTGVARHPRVLEVARLGAPPKQYTPRSDEHTRSFLPVRAPRTEIGPESPAMKASPSPTPSETEISAATPSTESETIAQRPETKVATPPTADNAESRPEASSVDPRAEANNAEANAEANNGEPQAETHAAASQLDDNNASPQLEASDDKAQAAANDAKPMTQANIGNPQTVANNAKPQAEAHNATSQADAKHVQAQGARAATPRLSEQTHAQRAPISASSKAADAAPARNSSGPRLPQPSTLQLRDFFEAKASLTPPAREAVPLEAEHAITPRLGAEPGLPQAREALQRESLDSPSDLVFTHETRPRSSTGGSALELSGRDPARIVYRDNDSDSDSIPDASLENAGTSPRRAERDSAAPNASKQIESPTSTRSKRSSTDEFLSADSQRSESNSARSSAGKSDEADFETARVRTENAALKRQLDALKANESEIQRVKALNAGLAQESSQRARASAALVRRNDALGIALSNVHSHVQESLRSTHAAQVEKLKLNIGQARNENLRIESDAKRSLEDLQSQLAQSRARTTESIAQAKAHGAHVERLQTEVDHLLEMQASLKSAHSEQIKQLKLDMSQTQYENRRVQSAAQDRINELQSQLAESRRHKTDGLANAHSEHVERLQTEINRLIQAKGTLTSEHTKQVEKLKYAIGQAQIENRRIQSDSQSRVADLESKLAQARTPKPENQAIGHAEQVEELQARIRELEHRKLYTEQAGEWMDDVLAGKLKVVSDDHLENWTNFESGDLKLVTPEDELKAKLLRQEDDNGKLTHRIVTTESLEATSKRVDYLEKLVAKSGLGLIAKPAQV